MRTWKINKINSTYSLISDEDNLEGHNSPENGDIIVLSEGIEVIYSVKERKTDVPIKNYYRNDGEWFEDREWFKKVSEYPLPTYAVYTGADTFDALNRAYEELLNNRENER